MIMVLALALMIVGSGSGTERCFRGGEIGNGKQVKRTTRKRRDGKSTHQSLRHSNIDSEKVVFSL